MSDNTTFVSIAELQRLIGGSSNSHSISMLNSVMAETIGMSMHNAVSTQHNAQTLNSAATTSTCARILSVMSNNDDKKSPVQTAVKHEVKKHIDNTANENKDIDTTQ